MFKVFAFMVGFIVVWAMSAREHEKDIIRNLKEKGSYELMFVNARLEAVGSDNDLTNYKVIVHNKKEI